MEKRLIASLAKSGRQMNTQTTENSAATTLRARYQATLRLSDGRLPAIRIQKSTTANAIKEDAITIKPIATNDSPIGVTSPPNLFTRVLYAEFGPLLKRPVE